MTALLQHLGYTVAKQDGVFHVTAPEGRKLIFLGDLVDRGPKVTDVLRFVMQTVSAGTALCVPGNMT